MNEIKDSVIFITGGAGFIGSYLVEELLNLHPKKIFILDNLVRGSHENMQNYIRNPAIEFTEGDIRAENLIDKFMSQSDYCFHMAALRINACAANPADGFDVMVKSTFNIAESARKNKIKKIIYSSSASVYGLAQHFPTPETDNPYDNQTFYGAAKLFGEQLFRSYYHMYKLNYVALRYFNVYGQRQDTRMVVPRFFEQAMSNQPITIFGSGLQTRDFTWVEDAVN